MYNTYNGIQTTLVMIHSLEDSLRYLPSTRHGVEFVPGLRGVSQECLSRPWTKLYKKSSIRWAEHETM